MSGPLAAEDWLLDPGTQAVLAMLEGGGHQAYFVGGCVRNALLGLPVADIDIATDAEPQRVMALASGAGLRCVPTGAEHGTVTVLSDGPHEITTFRRDVETDGRHAVVAFSDSLEEDAARRDFTMNALYADRRGSVLDPLGGGLADLRAGRLRFIGDPAERIREDGLRVLRFFRFSAAYAAPGAPLDPDGMAAVTQAHAALRPVSRERIGAEMRKLLGARDPVIAVEGMEASGVLEEALPGARAVLIAPLVAAERAEGMAPRWLRRLAALGMGDWADALRLSRDEARTLSDIRACQAAGQAPHAAAADHGDKIATDAFLLAAAQGTTLPPRWQADIALGATARFPLRAADLMPDLEPGPSLGAALSRLRQHWIESRFTLDREALLRLSREAR